VVPGDARPAYSYGAQARQILNDAEDDLRDWQPEPEPEADDVSPPATEQSDLSPERQRRSKGKQSEDSAAASQSAAGETAAPSVETKSSEGVGLTV